MRIAGGFLLAKGAPSSLRLTSRNNETAVELLGNTAAVQVSVDIYAARSFVPSNFEPGAKQGSWASWGK
jgi:hypothetical protein